MAVKEVQVDKNVEQPNKVLDILGYFIFLISLCTAKNEFDKYHANQALILVICSVAVNIVLGILQLIPGIGLIATLLSSLVGIGVLVLMIIGMLNASKLECKPLPLIGNLFQIIKY